MNTMTAAIISMAAKADVWANTVEAIFLDASFMALPLHPWFARQTARLSDLRSSVIVAENGAMTPRFLRRTPQDGIRPHVSPRGEYDMKRLDHQCGGILSRAIMQVGARRHIASHMKRLRITATRKA